MKKFICIIVLAGTIFFLNTCEVALGTLINIDYPVISNLPKGVQPGEYLSGNSNIVYLKIVQAFGIDYVFMTIWYADYLGQERQRVVPVHYDEAAKSYYVDIDTTGMTDGTIRAQVTAVDVDGKSTTTTDILYIVKNNPPQVEMSLPAVKGAEFDDVSMNYALEDIFMGGDLMGMASDVMGLEAGYPQILFWPVDYAGELDGYGVPLPSDKKWGQWRTVTDDKYAVLTRDNLKSVQFRWPLVELIEKNDGSWTLPDIANNDNVKELQTGNYRFKVRIKDKIGVVNTYPNRVDNIHDYNIMDERLNHYMEVRIVSPSGPVVRFQNVPQYYNGTKDYEATMLVTSANHVDFVRVGVSNNENTSSITQEQWIEAENVSGSLYKVLIPFDKMPDTFGAAVGSKTGDKVLHVTARDESGLTNDSRSFTLDNIMPSIEFLEPSGMGTDKPPRVTSTVVVRAVNSDNTRVSRLYYALGRTETNELSLNLGKTPMDMDANELDPGYGWIDTLLHTDTPVFEHRGMGNIRLAWSGNQYSWNLRFEDITEVTLFPTQAFDENGNHYVENFNYEENLWRLPIYLKIVDVAGNVEIFKESIIVDPNADIPYVEIRSHDNEIEQTVGGAVRVSGMAVDNEMIYSVEVRISAQRDGECDTDAPAGAPVTNGFVPVEIIGGMGSTVSWYYNINQEGELNPPAGAETRAVLMEFRAADASLYQPNVFKRNGSITELKLKISNAVPVVQNITIIKGKPSQEGEAQSDPYVFGSKAAGFVTLKATVRAQEGIESILVNLQGTSNYVPLGKNPSDTAPFMTIPILDIESSGDYYESDIYIPIDTRSVLYGSLANSAGSYEIALQITDGKATPYMAHRTLTIYIDNYSPMASYNGYLNAVGSNFSISGRAWDTADNITIQGVEMVVVYFSRAGEGIPLKEKEALSADWVTNQIAKQNRRGTTSFVTNEGTSVTLPFFPDVRKPDGSFATTNSGIVIKESGDTGDYFATFTGNPEKDWSVSFNTNQLEDGPVTLNYAVFDTAGNASHYTQDIYIANNRPLITSINLGTDIQADGNAHYFSYDIINSLELTSNFRIRNDLFAVRAETLFGNGDKYYKVFYTEKTGPLQATAIRRGNVYTIANPGNIEWINYGVFERPQGGNYIGATFVATCDYYGTAEGSVYSYAHRGNSNTLREGALNENYAQDIFFNAQSFGSEPLISDSVLTDDGNGNPVLNRNRYFVIKVYDSTIPLGEEKEQLSQAIVINADVNNIDIIKPKMTINPFFWNNAENNSLYQNNKENGHIEFEADLNTAIFNQSSGLRDMDPKVSGIVSIRGSAFDDNAIGSLYFKIDGFTDNEAQQGSGGAAGYYRGASFDYGRLRGIDRLDSAGWKFSIINYTHNMSGHNVTWQLDFNSARVAGVTALDAALNVIAGDRTPNYCDTSNLQTSESSPTQRYRMDIVPYISVIETNQSLLGGLGANYIRSADGKYCVIQGNTDDFITVRGFNLNPFNVRILNEAGNNNFRNNPSSVSGGVTISCNSANATGSRPYTHFTMSNNLTRSGYLSVTVNGITALNNINNNEAAGSYVRGTQDIDEVHLPNRRADRYTTKNLRHTDDVYLQFYTVVKTDAVNSFYPVMMMEESAGQDVVVFGYVNDRGGGGGIYSSDARAQRAKFNITSGTRLDTEYLIQSMNTSQMGMTRDESGRYLHAVNYDRMYANFNLVYDRFAELDSGGVGWASGSRYISFNRGGSGSSYDVRNSWARAEIPYNNAITLENANFRQGTFFTDNRYQSPKLIARGNSVTSYANYYMCYYDASNSSIVFRNFRIGTWDNVRQGAADNQANRMARSLLQSTNPYSMVHQAARNLCVDSQGREYSAYTNLNAVSDMPPTPDLNDPRYNSETGIFTEDVIGGILWGYYDSGSDTCYGDIRRRGIAVDATNHFDMAVDSVGRPFVICKTIYGLGIYCSLNAMTGETGSYSSPTYSLPSGGSWRDFGGNVNFGVRINGFPETNVGDYVSMTIDAQDRLHIAAFDSSESDLIYILVENIMDSNRSVKYVKVDQFDSVGYWTDIKIHPSNGKPYIAYYNMGRVGSREAVKIAWPNFDITDTASVKPGVDEDGYTTGDWEYRTIPSIDPPEGADPKFQKVNLQFRNNINRDPVIGYIGKNLEFSYPVSE